MAFDRLWGALGKSEGIVPRGSRVALLIILAGTFLLRLGLGWWLPSIHHADEVFQVAEQANRSANGYGIEPWEFRTASRTVILPTLVAPV